MPFFLRASLVFPRFLSRPAERSMVVLQSLLQGLTAPPSVPVLLWQKELGHLASFAVLVLLCRLLMCPLQLHFLQFFAPLSDPHNNNNNILHLYSALYIRFKVDPPVSVSQGSFFSLGISGLPSSGDSFLSPPPTPPPPLTPWF